MVRCLRSNIERFQKEKAEGVLRRGTKAYNKDKTRRRRLKKKRRMSLKKLKLDLLAEEFINELLKGVVK